MSAILTRAHAAIALADAASRPDSERPETFHEWAARAPENPDAIARWIREAPALEEPPRLPKPAPDLASSGEIAALKAKVASLETKLTIATSRKGQAARRRGRGYLSAEYGGRDA